MKNILLVLLSLVLALVMGFKFYNVSGEFYVKEKVFNKSISLDYIHDNYYNIKTNIELNNEEQKKLYNLVNNLKFGINNTNCLVNPKYFIKYQDNELYLDEECGLAIYNDKEVMVTVGNKEIKEFLDSIIKNKENIYLYKLENNNYVVIDNVDKDNIKNIWNNMNKEEVVVDDIDFNYHYLLIINNQEIYIDIINSVCLYNNKLIRIDTNLINYFNTNTGCCSCCKHLLPNESCIDMCCPCS